MKPYLLTSYLLMLEKSGLFVIALAASILNISMDIFTKKTSFYKFLQHLGNTSTKLIIMLGASY